MSKQFICQYCNAPFFDSKNGYRNPKFCSMKCYKLSHSEIRLCKVCNKEFSCNKKYPKIYCSQACVNQNRTNKADKSKKTEVTCVQCGKVFTSWTYRKSTCCSRKCASKLSKGIPKPTNQKPEIHITKVCAACGKPYQTTTHHERLRGSNFCSQKCQGKATSQRMKGKGNPNYVDGSSPQYYGENWWRQRYKAKKRDNDTCQDCGAKNDWPKTPIDVHHKIPIRTFNGDYKRANRLSNLICLCRKCHRKREMKYRSLQ